MKQSPASVLFSILLLVSAAGAHAAGAGEENLQLPEDVLPQLKPLLEQAMRQSPRVLERNLDLQQAEADAYLARSSSLPYAGGGVTYQGQRERQVNGSGATDARTTNGERLYYNFAVTQAVWQWGALEAARRMSRIDRDLAQMNYGEAYRGLAAEIRAAYLGLVLQKMGVRNAELDNRLATENLSRQQARYSANQITYGEIMLQQLRLDESSLAMRRAKAELEFALGAFRSLCGDASFAETDIPDAIGDIAQAPLVSSVAASSATDLSAAVQMAEKEVVKAKLGVVAPRFALFPKVGLVAGVLRDELSRDIIENRKYQADTLYAGVQVNWAIFDGYASKGQLLAARIRLSRAERRLSVLREATARVLDRDRAAVGFTWDAYQVAQMRLRMAREGLAHQNEEAGRGLVSQEQVDAAQSHVFISQYSAQAALAAHLNAAVQYLSSKGMDPVVRSAVPQR